MARCDEALPRLAIHRASQRARYVMKLLESTWQGFSKGKHTKKEFPARCGMVASVGSPLVTCVFSLVNDWLKPSTSSQPRANACCSMSGIVLSQTLPGHPCSTLHRLCRMRLKRSSPLHPSELLAEISCDNERYDIMKLQYVPAVGVQELKVCCANYSFPCPLSFRHAVVAVLSFPRCLAAA